MRRGVSQADRLSLKTTAQRAARARQRGSKPQGTRPEAKQNGAAAPPPQRGQHHPQTPGGARAHKEARRSRARKPPRGSESARTPRRGAGQGGTGAPARSERVPKAKGREDAPQRPGAPRGAREGARRRGKPQSERKGGHSPQQEPLRADGAATTRSRGASAGGTPRGAKRARPPTRAAARGGHGEPDKAGRQNEPRPGESAYILRSELARNNGLRAGGATPRASRPVRRWYNGTQQRAFSRVRAAGARKGRRSRLAARGKARRYILDIGTVFRQK